MTENLRCHGECRCGWKSAESYDEAWAQRERARHEQESGGYIDNHLTFTGWRQVRAA